MMIFLPVRAGHRVRTPRSLAIDYESPIDPFVDIKPGDLVVHILHGIARYRGIKSLPNKENKAQGRREKSN